MIIVIKQEWQHSWKQCSRNNMIKIDKYRVAANITNIILYQN